MVPLRYEISFKVLDAATMEKVQPSEFKITEKGKSLNVRQAGGMWHVLLAPDTNYEVIAGKDGYERFDRALVIEKPVSPKDVQKTILLGKAPPRPKPSAVAPVSAKSVPKTTSALEETSPADSLLPGLNVGDKVVLRTVFFDQSSYIIRPELLPELNALVRTLRTNSTLRIQLEGHTDNTGDPRLNQYLSEHRAKVLHSYLINHGVEENRVSWKGFGGSQPIAPNDTEENKAKNRRVEYKILKK
ncbi:OmpA family protein [Arundinibacter roseus]|uniref:OmpA family protein n=2 Tax=Arundinibacter roseus TaxID=2070510 RepID=A0A4R4K8Y5_9BACT|nr:OmpA family protein [Arundinibacter roseus]